MSKALVASFVALICATPALAQTGDTPSKTLKTNFINAEGKQIGTATLSQTLNGVLIQTDLRGLPPGEHGFHIHETGKCEANNGFESAGGHFAPRGQQHGFLTAGGPHAGDLPNQIVGQNGRLQADVLAAYVTLEAGRDVSLLDQDGSALVVHSKADDYKSQPSGNAGDRIACAVISSGRDQQAAFGQRQGQALNTQPGRAQTGSETDKPLRIAQNSANQSRSARSEDRRNPAAQDRSANRDASGLDPDLQVTVSLIYQGWSAKDVIGQTVYGPNGNELGEVQDLIVNSDGTVKSIVVEGGGFLDIGDATFRIAWSKVDMTPGQEGVSVPISEEQAEDRGLYEQPEEVYTSAWEFRANQFIGDYARLRNGAGYGYVSDLVFNNNGKVIAVLVDRDLAYGGGTYGYPYYGSLGWRPGSGYYALPFDTLDVAAQAPRVEKDRIQDAS